MLGAEPEVPELSDSPPESRGSSDSPPESRGSSDSPPDSGRRHLPALLAVIAVAVGAGYRFAMLTAHAPPTNSDEAVMGLAALHVRTGQGHPAFFYGQHYMGTLEAYLAVPFFALSEPSVLALRLPNLLLYAAFLGLLWQLTRRLYSPWFATFVVGLLALGSDRILKNQMIAGGGYPEMNPAGTLLLLLGLTIALPGARRRLPWYALWGLVAGLMLWDDWLLLPYVLAAAALPAVFRARDLYGRAGLVTLAGLLLGAAPMIAHFVAIGRNPLAVLLGLGGAEGDPSWPDRLYGGVLFGLPMGTGMCAPGRCAPWQLWWGVAFPVLLVVAGVLAVRALRAARSTGAGTGDGDRQRERVRQAGRLALVGAAALSLLAYARTGAAGSSPVESARYLSCLLISLPAVLWPLWRGAQRGRPAAARPEAVATRDRPVAARPRAVVTRVAAVAVLTGVVVTSLVATGALVARLPSSREQDEQRRALVATLTRIGVTRLYSDYWTCNNITFASRERIICAVLGDDLRPGLDRYLPYRRAVDRADSPAYVLVAGSALDRAVASHLERAGATSTVVSVGGYAVYRPARPVGLPLR